MEMAPPGIPSIPEGEEEEGDVMVAIFHTPKAMASHGMVQGLVRKKELDMLMHLSHTARENVPKGTNTSSMFMISHVTENGAVPLALGKGGHFVRCIGQLMSGLPEDSHMLSHSLMEVCDTSDKFAPYRDASMASGFCHLVDDDRNFQLGTGGAISGAASQGDNLEGENREGGEDDDPPTPRHDPLEAEEDIFYDHGRIRAPLFVKGPSWCEDDAQPGMLKRVSTVPVTSVVSGRVSDKHHKLFGKKPNYGAKQFTKELDF